MNSTEPLSSLEVAINDYKSALESLLAACQKWTEWQRIGLSQVEDYSHLGDVCFPTKLMGMSMVRAATESSQSTTSAITNLQSQVNQLATDLEMKRRILFGFPAFSRFYRWVLCPCDVLMTQPDGSPYQVWAVEIIEQQPSVA